MSKRKMIFTALVPSGHVWESRECSFTNHSPDHLEVTVRTLTTAEQVLAQKVEALESEIEKLKG